MKTIYIHAGPEKTGSTSIQSFLKANKDNLKSQNFEYASLNFFSKKIRRVNELVKDQHKKESFKKKIFSKIYKIKTKNIILSNENILDLENNNQCKDMITTLHFLLSEFDVKFIFYIRRFDKYLESRYVHRLLRFRPFTSTFDEYYNTNYENIINNFRDSLEQLSMLFGKENIILKKFDNTSFKENNLSIDFLSIFNISKDKFINIEKKENEGADLNIVEDIRHYKIFLNKNKLPLFNFSALKGFRSSANKHYSLMPDKLRKKLIKDTNIFLEESLQFTSSDSKNMTYFRVDEKEYCFLPSSTMPSDQMRMFTDQINYLRKFLISVYMIRLLQKINLLKRNYIRKLKNYMYFNLTIK